MVKSRKPFFAPSVLLAIFISALLLHSVTAQESNSDDASPDDALAAKTPPPAPTKAPPPKVKLAKKDDKKSGRKDDAKKPERFEDEKPFDEMVKGMEVTKGLFTFYRKVDDGRTYMEIMPSQFDKQFLFSSSVDQSVGERGLYAAQMAGEFPFAFRLVGRSVQMLIKNSLYAATNDTPEARALARSFPVSMLGNARIISRPHPDRKSLLINAWDMFITDIPGFASALKETYRPSDYRFDRGNSNFGAVKSFPENSLLEVWLHYVTENPRGGTFTLPDARSIPIVMKYDIVELKKTAYRPRLADDRVGHFLSVQADYSSDVPKSLMIRRINRWNLEKKDQKAALSEPKKPITFWLENTIPVEYRPSMREGILLWNKAFERIGFTNAIVVRQQSDSSDWDPADSRYNTVRWFQGVDASFAIGPSRANPYTGEIYDADIGFSEGIIRSIRRHNEEFIGPVSGAAPIATEAPARPKFPFTRDASKFCDHANGMAEQAAFGVNVLQARGALDKTTEDRLLREYLIEVTAHEVGHTLGLRHNFRASNMLKPAELLDMEITEKQSQSGSVMDYNPIVIAGKGQKQGHFVPTTLGPYDYWAIEYAYKEIEPASEPAELAKIASRCAEAGLAYSTDEDAMGTYSAAAMDPMVNQFDQSSDPLGFFADRIGIIRELWAGMEANLLQKGDGYQVLRRSMNRSINEYYRSLMIASKFVGGIYHRRDHFGDENGRTPYEPVAADRQREAVAFLQKYAFAENAFDLPPTLLNRLAIERLPGISGLDGLYSTDGRADYAWHDSILNLQRNVLWRLYQSLTLGRLQDNEMRFAPGEKIFTMADMFAGFDAAIWSELDEPHKIKALRRNLQREHLKQLIRLSVRSIGAPEDATSLARASLKKISSNIQTALAGGRIADPATIAHLEETHERIKSALDAKLWKSAE
jgi:hypothetical protein